MISQKMANCVLSWLNEVGGDEDEAKLSFVDFTDGPFLHTSSAGGGVV